MGGRGAGFNKKNKGSIITGIADSDLKVKDWFQNKIELPNYVMHPRHSELHWGGMTILEKRPKAIKVGFTLETLDGERDIHLKRWIPKSALESRKAYQKAEQEREKASLKKYNEGKTKYDKLIKFAKENNVKGVRVGLRKDTIIAKLKDKGIDYKW